MPNKLTDNEIVKALEQRIKDLPCIHEKYEPACGMWCEHLHMWCIDFNNKSLKEKCSEYKPCCSMSLEKQALDLINRLQAENERLKEPTSASESLQKENEEYKTEIMRLEHNVRVLSENSIIAKYPHHWLLDEGWFLSKELDGYGKFKAQVSNEAIIGFVGRLKAKAEVFPELRLIVIKEKDWDNLLKELVGE